MKRVLLLAFYFPPRNHIAGYRTGCYAKYLPENGWQPTVICEDWPPDKPDYDPDFAGVMPPEAQIIRLPNPAPRSFYQKVILRKVLPYFRPACAPYLWWSRVRAEIGKLMRTQHFDVIWATSDPLAPLGLAEEASRRFGVPWVADIRDSFNIQPMGSWYKRPIWAWHERRFCRRADHVVAVSRGMAEGLAQLVRRPVEVIENGFDPDLFGPVAVSPDPIFTLVYTGHLVFPQRNPRPVFEALERCFAQGTIPRGDFEIRFYGPAREQLQHAYPGVMDKLPVRLFPKVPHRQVVAIQKAATALLLLAHAGEKGVLTGKVFDYLAAERPILAVPDDHSEIAQLLTRTGTGKLASTVVEISDLLADWYRRWKLHGGIPMPRNQTAINYYSRRSQTTRLARILEKLAAQKPA